MKTAKVTRILHSQGLHTAKCERLARIAALCGRVRTDAWQRCRNPNRCPDGWGKGIMADTRTSISRRRGSALELANPAYTSHLNSRTGQGQDTRCRNQFYGLDGVVLNADTNAARNNLQRLDDGITLYSPYREGGHRRLDRSGTTDGTAHPGLEPARQLALP